MLRSIQIPLDQIWKEGTDLFLLESLFSDQVVALQWAHKKLRRIPKSRHMVICHVLKIDVNIDVLAKAICIECGFLLSAVEIDSAISAPAKLLGDMRLRDYRSIWITVRSLEQNEFFEYAVSLKLWQCATFPSSARWDHQYCHNTSIAMHHCKSISWKNRCAFLSW